MIVSFISEFAEYLNQNGFSITESKIRNFLKLSGGGGLDIADEDVLITALSVALAQNRQQSEKIRPLFHEFVENRERIQAELERQKEREAYAAKTAKEREMQISEMQEQIEAEEQRQQIARTADEQQEAGIKQKIGELEEQIRERAKEVREKEMAKDGVPAFPAKKTAQLKDAIGGKTIPDEELSKLLDKMLGGDPAWMQTDKKRMLAALAEETEKALRDGQLAKASAYMEIRKRLAKENDEKKEQEINRKIRAGCADLEAKKREQQEKKEALLRKQREEAEALAAKRKEVERMLKEMQKQSDNELTVKESAKTHRQEFVGMHAVWAYNPEISTFEDKGFNQLTAREKETLYYYVRKNLLSFKTRMTRNIRSGMHRSINIGATVTEAVRTGGLPMRLIYDLPKRSKADLILILDVSGSCKEASGMMLTFIGILKEVFPRGCKAYAFVNSLYDISDVYEAVDIEKAIKKTLEMIPRAGQYSNYYVPLSELWESHRQDFKKDSTVIFIGDARNNKNDPGEYFLKNICRKVKKAYWLNTEKVKDWNTADSQAALYGRYAKMYEAVNVSELLGFIAEMR